MTDKFDPRLTPARADLAAESLRGKVDSKKYSKGNPAEVIVGISPLYRDPDHNAPRETELLFGEEVTVYDAQNGWAWVQNKTDNYVGYTPHKNLGDPQGARTHIISALRTYIFSDPDIKSRPLGLISMNSKIQGEIYQEKFIKCTNGGFICAHHTIKTPHSDQDFVNIAEQFMGTPYLWGGRSSLGLDCSALVQNSLALCGNAIPRDTDMQEKAVGNKIATDLKVTSLQRGDLVFWKGHVAIMQNSEDIVHANGTWMCVSSDNVYDFSERIFNETGPVTSIRRL